ncbi:hypothetical protein PPYR_00861 [Photinus pyralis]|uniref:Protein HEXIM1 n=1 Tax=Photinus pyralis TaxID=7054 RepID=A0A1Y1MX07_PHOPY|nr:protein HEXIM1-like [Photinus pyralis]XP_031347957.1 protein HEXIM1-like [Photinus pyralis]KAB0795731.1 hypothetical protein PPYR_09792 [Photinus pyralis]KAB0803891.1 hypothetical protein PPYR_00861 [Photinus pyralis]
MCSNLEGINHNLTAVGALHQDDVDERIAAHAATNNDATTNKDDEIPPKKRKTRRGRNKRRHPYLNTNMNRKSWNATKPDAPHNSNQFLIEDQGTTKEIDDCLKNDKMARTRDSSFSMDSDGEFYSSPDGEEAFLRKDFDDTYEKFRTERFNAMTKGDIIEEFLQLEQKFETVLQSNKNGESEEDKHLQKEVDRLLLENETLKREISDLRNQILISNSSVDSESDSSESCSTSSSSANDTVKEVIQSDDGVNDYSQMNGHSPSYLQTV